MAVPSRRGRWAVTHAPPCVTRSAWPPLRCWPHHFDIGTLLHMANGTVGLGFSVGDEEIPEPYWYVRAHPAPGGDPAPGVLPFGEWHLVGWHAAILRASQVNGLPSGDARLHRATRFLDAAVAANGTLLLLPR